mmetsp:Transcript_28013/g.70963  ORF Transcript_28013/g.70963 Transcript_28013/m.70963 type:complete len:240 (+) Transcript_28013:8812-9531(+)|eukprot:g7801.t1
MRSLRKYAELALQNDVCISVFLHQTGNGTTCGQQTALYDMSGLLVVTSLFLLKRFCSAPIVLGAKLSDCTVEDKDRELDVDAWRKEGGGEYASREQVAGALAKIVRKFLGKQDLDASEAEGRKLQLTTESAASSTPGSAASFSNGVGTKPSRTATRVRSRLERTQEVKSSLSIQWGAFSAEAQVLGLTHVSFQPVEVDGDGLEAQAEATAVLNTLIDNERAKEASCCARRDPEAHRKVP